MRRFFTTLAILVLAGCANGGTETGNAMGVTVRALSSANPGDLSPQGPDAQGTVFTVETAYTYIDELEFDLPEGTTCADYPPEIFEAPVFCEEEDGDDGFKIEGPYVIDLVAGTSVPTLAGLTIPSASYRRVDVGIQPSEPDGPPIPAPLVTHAIYVAGSLVYQANPVTFELALDFDEDARFEDVQGVTARDVLLALDVADWFAALPITQCLDDGDLVINAGTLTIADSGGGCSAIEEALKNAIRDSGELDNDNENEGPDEE